MNNQPAAPVRSSVVVDVAIDQAFLVFTEQIAGWWPPEHHIIEAPLAEMVFEPWAGGHVYDVGVDGSQCRWARVLVYERPRRVTFSWDINLQWKIETDPDRTSEVEVTFVAETPERTRVVLEHRHIERHGEGWEGMHRAVGSPDGWDNGLRCFAVRVSSGTVIEAS